MNNDKPIQYGLMTGDPDTDLHLTELDRQIDVAMDGLTTNKQRRFVELYAAGDGSQSATSCAITAGYKMKTAYVQASDNLRKPKIVLALNLLRRRYAYQSGISTAWKRKQLVEFVEMSKQGDKPQIMAGAKCVELLAKLDGEIETSKHQGSSGGSAGTVIVINTGIPERPSITVDAEVVDAAVTNIEKHHKKHNED